MKNISMTKKDLADIAGYTYRRLYDIDRALPEDGKLFVEGADGKCDLALFVQRWVAYNAEKGSGAEMALDEVRAIHETVKTQKTRIEVAKLEGQLVDIRDVYRLWADVAKTVTLNMTRLPSKLAPLLIMMDSADKIKAVIEEEMNAALTAIADTPVPVVDAVTVDKEQDGDSE